MSLSQELQRYLIIRRNLGYDLYTDERVLKRFVSFLESKNETHITTNLFLEWKRSLEKRHKIPGHGDWEWSGCLHPGCIVLTSIMKSPLSL